MTTDKVAPTRRERQRQATFAEIVETSRGLLTRGEKPSLRAVAGAMGMTPPALYRYVDSHQELLQLVAMSIFDDVILALTEARDRYPDDDPAAQVISCAIAFRRWALAHPQEFGLIFASTETAKDEGASPDQPGGGAFGLFFGDIYVRIYQKYRFPVPTDEEMDPMVVAAFRDHDPSIRLPCDFPGMPLGLGWVFMRAWSRLYGTVTIEVFRHLEPAIIDSGALFAAMLEDNGTELSFGEDWPRLRDLARAELSR